MRTLVSLVSAFGALFGSVCALAQSQPPQPVPTSQLPAGHPPVGPASSASDVTHGLPPVPLAPPAIFPSQLEGEDELALAGMHGGRPFIRDAQDDFRLYPGGRLRTDFYVAPGSQLPSLQGGNHLHPQVAVRRLRLELSGEMFERLAFTGGIELGGQRIGETAGAFVPSDRFAMASAHDGSVLPGEVTVSYRFRDWLSLTVGQQNVPFSMSNRTREYATTFMERNLAIRGLAVPYDKELGLTIWGELFGKRALSYELGVFTGDGPSRPAVDARGDFAGRIYARPLAHLGDSLLFEQAQIGVSMRHGERDQNYVAYDYPNIATSQGWVLWQPGYVDSLDRATRVIPSGAQNAIGGELRVPFELPVGGSLDLKAEAYYVVNNTREAVFGYEQTNTERFGRLKGVGWYAQVDWWVCCADRPANGEPGVYRPYHVDLEHDAPVLRGLELSLLAAGIVANYSGATREESSPDLNTPASNIAVYQFGTAVQYWFSHNFRAALNYSTYFAPDSGDSTKNQVVVPDDLPGASGAVGGGDMHHELGMRLAVTF